MLGLDGPIPEHYLVFGHLRFFTIRATFKGQRLRYFLDSPDLTRSTIAVAALYLHSSVRRAMAGWRPG